jgi:hypothetical protein
MSTKTLRKRIALVAVSALGFGLMTVVPANAGTLTHEVDGIAMTTSTVTTAVGTTVSTTFAVSLDDVTQATETAGVISSLIVPAGSGVTVADGDASGSTLATINNTGKSATLTSTTFTSPLTKFVAVGAITAATSTLAGTITFIPDVAGTYVYTLRNATAADDTISGSVVATFTVIATAQNAARNAFINKSTTVDDAGAAYTATALSAASSTATPGTSYTANGAVTDSVATMTVPAGAAIVFTLTGSTTWSTGTKARLAMNGSTVSELACTISTVSCVLASYTAPSTAGTYNAVFTVSGANASFDPALTETIAFTITVGSSASGLADFGNATATTTLHVPSVGVTIVDPSGRVGVPIAFAPNFKITNGTAGALNGNTASARLRYSVTLPAGTAGSVVDAAVSGVATTNQTVQGATESISAATSSATNKIGTTVYVIPATAGTYTITVYHDADRSGTLSAGEASATANVAVAADGLPSITFTKYGSNVTNDQSGDGATGQLVKVSLRNGTTPYTLASNETLVLSAAASTTDFLRYTTFAQGVNTPTDVAANVSEITLTRANFNGDGDAWFNIGDTTDAGGTFSVSAVINGGTANGASGSFTITTINTDQATAADLTDYTLVAGGVTISNANNAAGTYSSTADTSVTTNETGTWYVAQGVSQAVSAKITYGATNYALYSAVITDTLGLITGLKGGTYVVNATGLTTGAVATSSLNLSVTIPATTAALPTNTTVATMTVDATNDIVITIATQTPAVDSIAVDPSDLVTTTHSVRAAAASANTFKAYVLDQYGNALAGRSVTAQVTSGRNQQTIATSLLSDSSGSVSFKVTDAYVGTLLNSDTLKFISNAKEGVVTINYAAYNPASKVDITGGASADVAPAVTLSQISTAVAGASTSTARVKMTATVTDANGATLPAGIPVKWAISGLTGTSAILVDATTGYDWSTSMTDSNGQAITYVYAWANGTVSVTATAGTVTSATAGKINFINADSDARVVSATANANGVITAKVVDRYGNGVKGVSITATRTAGTGYFGGNAASSTSGTTNADGTVDFIVVGGQATVTIATTTLNFGQTSSASGFVGATAVTATGIGASLAPAGVQSVSIAVTGNTEAVDAATAAVDAAAEATDAANAATDAANAAAEAADAATAAAQDAADAVAALATSVSEMVDALKKQITSLTNLVIKIQKKVRA